MGHTSSSKGSTRSKVVHRGDTSTRRGNTRSRGRILSRASTSKVVIRGGATISSNSRSTDRVLSSRGRGCFIHVALTINIAINNLPNWQSNRMEHHSRGNTSTSRDHHRGRSIRHQWGGSKSKLPIGQVFWTQTIVQDIIPGSRKPILQQEVSLV
jgi:hypothetical protein